MAAENPDILKWKSGELFNESSSFTLSESEVWNTLHHQIIVLTLLTFLPRDADKPQNWPPAVGRKKIFRLAAVDFAKPPSAGRKKNSAKPPVQRFCVKIDGFWRIFPCASPTSKRTSFDENSLMVLISASAVQVYKKKFIEINHT